jgi:ribonuclease E
MHDSTTETGDVSDAAAGSSEATGDTSNAFTDASPIADAIDNDSDSDNDSPSGGEAETDSSPNKRRRGSRGGQNRRRPSSNESDSADVSDGADDFGDSGAEPQRGARDPDELPEPIGEGKVKDPGVAERALVRKPQIGDTRPLVPTKPPPGRPGAKPDDDTGGPGEARTGQKRRKRGGKGGGGSNRDASNRDASNRDGSNRDASDGQRPDDDENRRGADNKRKRRGGRGRGKPTATELELIEQRGGRERNGKPIGRYFMCVQVRPGMAQVAVLEGRSLIEHYVSRPADDVSQIHGNIYLGRVQNVLPGMEAAFVDIATPKNAVLYRGDVQYDPEDIEERGKNARIEDILKARQMIMCQVTKNPIGAKGARLTQEVSLPGRFVVLIPNSKTYGISKRLPDDTRKRLRNILDRVKPEQHGLIVRTAAEHATEADLEADMDILLKQWGEIERKAAKATKPALLYREPELAVRVIREEFNPDYRGVVIDDPRLFEEVRDYVKAFNPELADRIEYYDTAAEGLALFERQHVHEQVHKALDRKVWLPSGGSLIIEHTEALSVIDVNTGKNVGKSNLEETVFHNNMEAAEEIAKQLRLRDIGGIIVIDFIDMEIRDNRAKVVAAFRDALARDKTRTQVFDITELGLVEMTRKRIGEGLLTEFSEICPDCEGRGVKIDHELLE